MATNSPLSDELFSDDGPSADGRLGDEPSSDEPVGAWGNDIAPVEASVPPRVNLTELMPAPPPAPRAIEEPVTDVSGLDLLMDISLQVSVELGRTKMSIGDVLALRFNSVIELDKLAGEPADIFVSGTRVARGEVVVVDEKFGVRILDVISKDKRLAMVE